MIDRLLQAMRLDTVIKIIFYAQYLQERQDLLLLERMEACHHITGSKIFNSLLLLVMIVPSNSRQRLIYMFQCSTVPVSSLNYSAILDNGKQRKKL